MQDEPLDSGDLDALIELQRSRGYALVSARIEEEIERRQAELEQPYPEDVTNGIRGQLRALRTVLRIPDILKGEIKP